MELCGERLRAMLVCFFVVVVVYYVLWPEYGKFEFRY